MIGGLVKMIFGSHNEKELKRIRGGYLARTNALEEEIKLLSDEELVAKTPYFKEKLSNGATLEDIMPEAFAVCREASWRTLHMRHFDVQIIGGVVLHEGKITEMRTGEGKTLTSTLPIYLNALSGKGVHLVTVNDYLAKRDAEWMGAIYTFLGLTVGVIQHGIDDQERKAAYRCDITYGQNNEFGFDYLRDNMKFDLEDLAQRKLNYAIVDEVDSILIDEARTPLIISGQAEDSTDKYYTINRIIPKLLQKDVLYTVDEKAKNVMLTEEGVAAAETALKVGNLYDPQNMDLLHHVQQGLKAYTMFTRDVDYVVKDGSVMIVDEFTGRLMPGRRWSDGLHQAVEAKEQVKIENENQTLASITFQNYFRMYDKLAGMTGTADTEAVEFAATYDLEVIVIPTNQPMIRRDMVDQIYMTGEEKDEAIVEEAQECHVEGQPVLVGTISIEKSEKLADMLTRKGMTTHKVLNAKHHESEADIVAQAGRKGAVTIATNMAGRGTDIILGGNPEMLLKEMGVGEYDENYEDELEKITEQCKAEHEEVLKAGGLHIIGTERHESRRIDNQLRGRSGRQGDPGSSRFFLSMEDDLLRIFGSERIQNMMSSLGMEKGEPIEHKMVSKAIENAQNKVEGHNFDMRKHLLEYDDVMNKQREVIYDQRRLILDGEELGDTVLEMAYEVLDDDLATHTPESAMPEEWDIEGLAEAMAHHFDFEMNVDEEKNITFGGEEIEFASVTFDVLRKRLDVQVKARLEEKEASVGDERWLGIEKWITLNIVDNNWKDHLLGMDHLKEGVGLRGYAQKNPLNEYKREGSAMFHEMVARIREDAISALFHVRIQTQQEAKEEERLLTRKAQKVTESHGDSDEKPETVRRDGKKVGRNDPCPCGSGKKFKKCHGANK